LPVDVDASGATHPDIAALVGPLFGLAGKRAKKQICNAERSEASVQLPSKFKNRSFVPQDDNGIRRSLCTNDVVVIFLPLFPPKAKRGASSEAQTG